MEHYYHLFANGDDAKNFITSTIDFETSFNRFAICAAQCPDVKILVFSIEETHPHALLFGNFENCLKFKRLYETLTYSYIISSRSSKDGVVFELELYQVDGEDYLRNVAGYIMVQPTKDGKKILPYDYRWGTASLYFRPDGYPGIWRYDAEWNLLPRRSFGDLSAREKKAILHSTLSVPDWWGVCGNLILPDNYIDINSFEAIFVTHNRFRVFISAGRNQHEAVISKMAQTRGISMEDIEARELSRSLSEQLFGKKDSRWLSVTQRLQLAKELRIRHRLTIRQITTLSRLPEQEIRKYIR